MGQRLNIEMMYGDTLLANAYYHWSAYTADSCELARSIIDKIESGYADYAKSNMIAYATFLLNATGAGITEAEYNAIKDRNDLQNVFFPKAIDRNEGLIAITEKEQSNTRHWEEGRVTFHLDRDTFDFDVIAIIGKAEYEEYYYITPDHLPKISNNFNFAEIPYNKIYRLREIIDIARKHDYYIRYKNSVIGIIE